MTNQKGQKVGQSGKIHWITLQFFEPDAAEIGSLLQFQSVFLNLYRKIYNLIDVCNGKHGSNKSLAVGFQVLFDLCFDLNLLSDAEKALLKQKGER